MPVEADPSLAERLGLSGFAFGLIALGLCWWFPFGAVVGACGALSGVAGWIGGDRRAILSTLLAVSGMGAALLLDWDDWRQVLGF